LIGIYVPHGSRGRRKTVNEAEADVIVDEIATLTARPEMRNRTIGVISLVGAEQADPPGGFETTLPAFQTNAGIKKCPAPM
jgi:hypothetical protein